MYEISLWVQKHLLIGCASYLLPFPLLYITYLSLPVLPYSAVLFYLTYLTHFYYNEVYVHYTRHNLLAVSALSYTHSHLLLLHFPTLILHISHTNLFHVLQNHCLPPWWRLRVCWLPWRAQGVWLGASKNLWHCGHGLGQDTRHCHCTEPAGESFSYFLLWHDIFLTSFVFICSVFKSWR